jgi:hypothetical protein
LCGAAGLPQVDVDDAHPVGPPPGSVGALLEVILEGEEAAQGLCGDF